ncbi:hypothetical protein BDK51DRAFT_31199 [Blyttiomyces helicus]|uniref:Uncharacterized protein n=1 Tax=Blyttiomyces helicus TaxID=388810 RepID=A0A4P9WPU1_9FUNG|nr:hypothetical protein BDK51DRAFT_31199 [Blyttiomyces helicus]|eukprot:RKO93280.1 hypothetical protein BDK51DRAFT_31199 [Blyttiomyces helicus]
METAIMSSAAVSQFTDKLANVSQKWFSLFDAEHQIEIVEDVAIEIPEVSEDLALYIARGPRNMRAASRLHRHAQAKLLGEIDTAVQESEGAEVLRKLHTKQGDAIWKTFWPVGRAFDDTYTCAKWTEQYKIAGICPQLVFIKELRHKLENESIEAVETWVEVGVEVDIILNDLLTNLKYPLPPRARSDSAFPRMIATSVFRTVTMKTVSANGLNYPVE